MFKTEIREFFKDTPRPYQAIAECKGHYVEFMVFEGIDDKFIGVYPYDHEKEPLFVGSIKWDGCSNWDFKNMEQMHFCGKTEAKNLGVLMAGLYELASELMPDNKENLEDD